MLPVEPSLKTPLYPERGPKDRPAAKTVVIERHEAGQRPDEVWKVPQPPRLLDRGARELTKFETLEVSKPTVDDSKRVPTRGAPEIFSFEQERSQTTSGGLECETRALNSSADHDEIKALLRSAIRVSFEEAQAASFPRRRIRS